MKKIIVIAVVLVIAAALIYAATKPNSYLVERHIVVEAPASVIFPLINDFHMWAQWSPYEKIDPAMKKTYSGPAAGKGSVYMWEGNARAGTGSMEILESLEPSKISTLNVSKTYKASNNFDFTLAASGDGTLVTWTMYGASPYMMKVMGLFFSMDKMNGPSLEEGLGKLKEMAEKQPVPAKKKK
jgi:hypothetical protein